MQQVFFRPAWPSRPDLISRSVQHTKEGSSTGRTKVVSVCSRQIKRAENRQRTRFGDNVVSFPNVVIVGQKIRSSFLFFFPFFFHFFSFFSFLTLLVTEATLNDLGTFDPAMSTSAKICDRSVVWRSCVRG